MSWLATPSAWSELHSYCKGFSKSLASFWFHWSIGSLLGFKEAWISSWTKCTGAGRAGRLWILLGRIVSCFEFKVAGRREHCQPVPQLLCCSAGALKREPQQRCHRLLTIQSSWEFGKLSKSSENPQNPVCPTLSCHSHAHILSANPEICDVIRGTSKCLNSNARLWSLPSSEQSSRLGCPRWTGLHYPTSSSLQLHLGRCFRFACSKPPFPLGWLRASSSKFLP